MDPMQEECKAGAPEWVVTFGDMMSLLLCFFVLLLSFSTMETERFKIIAGYIREAFGVQVDYHYTEIPSGNTVVTVEFNPPVPGKPMIFKKINDIISELELDNLVDAEQDKDGVRIRMDGALVFPPGSASISPDAIPFLDHVAKVISESTADVVVEGHTDNTPMRSSLFPSNWELSAARAAAVVRFFESRGIPGFRLQAVGYGDTRPISENFTEEGRRKNRRVEILIRTRRGGR